MSGRDAHAYTTEVIKVEAFGDGPDEELVGESVRAHLTFSVPEAAVPVARIGSRPDDAFR
jgi:hypothetical protein